MDQRVSLVTVAVADRDRSRRFYVEGLGWEPFLEVADVVMFRIGEHLALSLWEQASFEAEVGPVRAGPGHAAYTLAHNVATEAEVDEVCRLAEAAGADVRRPQRREWGGYSGYFLDPDGTVWEVACAPDDQLGWLLP